MAIPLMALSAAVMMSPMATNAVENRVDTTASKDVGAPSPDVVDLDDREHQVTVSSDGLYYMDAVAENKPVRFIVDSGANTTILTQADARRLGIDPAKLHFRNTLVTANGMAPLSFTKVENLRIAGTTYTNVRIAVMGNGRGVSLLGQDMIRRFHHFSIDDGVLTVS
ncbi:retropepsin-like aspartic protease family protein [Sphingomonas bacterium]|uniref:retropepsin-like aspartic protease family protein n=1 Tax=Sphingomonas bacterium TaxID=1895847 RepID=UPI0015766C78|nr:retropepsin-like aspartic protease [Sphingomonas bacterium]